MLLGRQVHLRQRLLRATQLRMADCKDCAKPGPFWTGEPKGKEVTLNGIQCYISEPIKKTSRAVIMIPDIWGWEAPNSRLLIDRFAAADITAVLPDYFKGDNPDLEKLHKGDFADFMEWRGRHGDEAVVGDTEKVMAGLAADHGIKSVGLIGVCWGGRFAVLLGATDKVKAVVMNHGSFVIQEHIEAIKVPLLINGADNDRQISREMLAQFQGVLDCKKDVPSDVKLFEGAEHGWTVRGDDKDPVKGAQIKEAFERALGWFQKHL